MRYAIIIEKGPRNYGAYAPDVPGCGAVGESATEARENLASALRAHLALLAESGEALPKAMSSAEYMMVEAPVVMRTPVRKSA